MKKNYNILITTITFILITLIIYALFIPSSQVFWKTEYKTTNGEMLFTFDDGPGEQTPEILDVLKEHNTSAIFFINCAHINETEDEVLIRMIDEGHKIGLHGDEHKINEDYETIKSCKNFLENITGEQVLYFRPPYGFKAPRTMSAAQDLNMTIMLWSVFPRDFSAKSSEQIVQRVTSNLESNSIVCLHDGPANREKTVEAFRIILE